MTSIDKTSFKMGETKPKQYHYYTSHQIIANLLDYFRAEQQNGGPLTSLNAVYKRVADATGVSTVTISQINLKMLNGEIKSINEGLAQRESSEKGIVNSNGASTSIVFKESSENTDSPITKIEFQETPNSGGEMKTKIVLQGDVTKLKRLQKVVVVPSLNSLISRRVVANSAKAGKIKMVTLSATNGSAYSLLKKHVAGKQKQMSRTTDHSDHNYVQRSRDIEVPPPILDNLSKESSEPENTTTPPVTLLMSDYDTLIPPSISSKLKTTERRSLLTSRVYLCRTCRMRFNSLAGLNNHFLLQH